MFRSCRSEHGQCAFDCHTLIMICRGHDAKSSCQRISQMRNFAWYIRGVCAVDYFLKFVLPIKWFVAHAEPPSHKGGRGDANIARRWAFRPSALTRSARLSLFVETKVFRVWREVHTKFKFWPSKYQRAHHPGIFTPPLLPKLDNRNVGEPPTRPRFDNDIEHRLLLKFAIMYPNASDKGSVLVVSFVASRMTAAPFSIFREW